jgi:mono/diheme cytochrome c family protein
VHGWRLLLAVAVASLSLAALAEADGSWLHDVPTREHERNNPFRDQSDAISAGKWLYAEHCSKCHGQEGQGTRKKPPLKSERVQQQASEGDLHWLLVNGNLRHGMPSWSKLPDPQLWQLISYLKTMHN